MDTRVIIILIAEAILALLMLYASGVLKKPGHVLISSALLTAAFVLRGFLLNHQTYDYQDFLTKWVSYFSNNGGFNALSGSIGNYNIPYLYFLAWFSYSDIRDLYLIKCLSIFFDVILAWSSMKLVSKYTGNISKQLTCYFAVLFLPTVVLNGAYWGQCDSIYVAFAIMSIYLAMDNKPWLSMISIAVSFAFKLQAVFIMPVFMILLIKKKIKLYHFIAFPAAYIVSVLPAVLLGRPFADTLTLYFNQAGSIGSGLNYNSPSIFSILSGVANTAAWSKAAVIAAFAAMTLIISVTFKRNKHSTDMTILAASVLFSIVIPFLLPHMHDRYFFAADILTVVLFCVSPEWFVLPCITQFASLLGYHAYLKMQYLLPMKYGGYAMLLAVVLAAVYFLKTFKKINNNNNGRMYS